MTRLIDRIWLNGVADVPAYEYIGRNAIAQTGAVTREARGRIDLSLSDDDLLASALEDESIPALLDNNVTAKRVRELARHIERNADGSDFQMGLESNPNLKVTPHPIDLEA